MATLRRAQMEERFSACFTPCSGFHSPWSCFRAWERESIHLSNISYTESRSAWEWNIQKSPWQTWSSLAFFPALAPYASGLLHSHIMRIGPFSMHITIASSHSPPLVLGTMWPCRNTMLFKMIPTMWRLALSTFWRAWQLLELSSIWWFWGSWRWTLKMKNGMQNRKHCSEEMDKLPSAQQKPLATSGTCTQKFFIFTPCVHVSGIRVGKNCIIQYQWSFPETYQRLTLASNRAMHLQIGFQRPLPMGVCVISTGPPLAQCLRDFIVCLPSKDLQKEEVLCNKDSVD